MYTWSPIFGATSFVAVTEPIETCAAGGGYTMVSEEASV